MPRTWCAPLTPDTEDIWPRLPYSEEECQLKKSTSKCWMSRIRTPHISLNGFPTTSSHQFAIFPPRDWRWPSPLSETLLLSRKCSRESLNNSPPCSEERLSSTGTPEKVIYLSCYIDLNRHGRDGIHWSWIQHERLGLRILIVLGCYSRRREWVWWRGGWEMITLIYIKKHKNILARKHKNSLTKFFN